MFLLLLFWLSMLSRESFSRKDPRLHENERMARFESRKAMERVKRELLCEGLSSKTPARPDRAPRARISPSRGAAK